MRLLRKILCFLGIHKYIRYERLRNRFGYPTDDRYMLVCKHCKKSIIK